MEFFTFESEIWYRLPNGTSDKLTENSTAIISTMLEKIEKFYPKAYSALCSEYSRCKPNLQFFRFRIVSRFIKCNFGNIDNVADVDEFGRFQFECVQCPLRGECRFENVICRPEFEHHISEAEMRVLRLWYQGLSKSEIAEKLYISPHTVNNHIRNAFVRLGIHEKAEFFRYAEINKLFL